MDPVDSVLARFRAALGDAYGLWLERVVLFGSHARGEARPASAYDVAVFLRDMLDRLADISTALLYDLGGAIHALPYRAGAYDERTPLMHESAGTASTCDAGGRRLPGAPAASPPTWRTAACWNTPRPWPGHASARTTKLYDRRGEQVSLDEVERITL